MYDALRSRYTFACPARGETHVTLSSFRRLERLPGAAHPAVFRITFACTCGDEHVGLVAHDDLDWAPLGLIELPFHDLMTSRSGEVGEELADISARRIQNGEWPWSFYCYPEERARPVYPSSFALLAPGGDALGIAVLCPTCARVSLNLVSPEHVDLPFHNDARVGVVEHHFQGDVVHAVDEFREELYSASFDIRRLALE
jgi:hypothetical protein